MKSKLRVAAFLLISLTFTSLWSQAAQFSRAVLSPNQTVQQTFLTLSIYPSMHFIDSLATARPARSVGRAAFFSLLIPGSGQFYNKSYLKGLAFVGVEIGAWVVNAKYTQRGNELTGEFERFADAHWDVGRYWASLEEDCKNRGGSCGDLKSYESASFSHFLPGEKNQTYYENIGKYDQFNAGWNDSKSGDARQRDSENREFYTRLRKKTNDQYDLATFGSSVVLINHVLSMLDAAYSTYRFNKNQAQAKLGLEMQRYDDELVPALSLNLQW